MTHYVVEMAVINGFVDVSLEIGKFAVVANEPDAIELGAFQNHFHNIVMTVQSRTRVVLSEAADDVTGRKFEAF